MILKIQKFTRKQRQGFTLVELMIVVAIISILAALAIPAFMRYIHSTRAAESEQFMDWITKGGISYFHTEQKYSSTDGDQPWHIGNPTPGQSDSYGMPVPLPVFPGFNIELNSHDGEGTFVDCGTAPQGGSKKDTVLMGGSPIFVATVKKLKLSNPGFTYFQYAYRSAGTGEDAEMEVVASADFKQGGLCHTVRRTVEINQGAPTVSPTVLTNEFE